MSNRDHTPHHRPDDDVLLQQVRAALSPVPSVNRRAIASILAAVAHRKPTRVQRLRIRWAAALEQWQRMTTPMTRGFALAGLAVVVGFVARGTLMQRSDPAASRTAAAPTPASPSPSTIQPVGGAADRAELHVPVQFVLDARSAGNATQVSVVGDFNNWDVSATPMTRDASVWTVSLPMSQGRHLYAFVMDGTRWLADPRAPSATDADFGRPTSVIIVQAP